MSLRLLHDGVVMRVLKRFRDFVEFVGIYRHDLELLRKAKADMDFATLWEYLHESPLSGICQQRSEIAGFLSFLRKSPPRVVLEIGTAKGGTVLLWAAVAADDACIITIDLPQGPFGGGHRRSQGWLYRRFGRKNQRLHFLGGDSHDPLIVERVKRILRGRPVNFLFIDGDHSREGVERDYQMYRPLVGLEGIIAFHDIVPGPPEAVGGVPDFWQELKLRVRCHEIIENPAQGGYGIGWLVKQ